MTSFLLCFVSFLFYNWERDKLNISNLFLFKRNQLEILWTKVLVTQLITHYPKVYF